MRPLADKYSEVILVDVTSGKQRGVRNATCDRREWVRLSCLERAQQVTIEWLISQRQIAPPPDVEMAVIGHSLKSL